MGSRSAAWRSRSPHSQRPTAAARWRRSRSQPGRRAASSADYLPPAARRRPPPAAEADQQPVRARADVAAAGLVTAEPGRDHVGCGAADRAGFAITYGMVQDAAVPGTQAEVFGWLSTAVIVGIAFGTALGGKLITHSGPRASMLLCNRGSRAERPRSRSSWHTADTGQLLFSPPERGLAARNSTALSNRQAYPPPARAAFRSVLAHRQPPRRARYRDGGDDRVHRDLGVLRTVGEPLEPLVQLLPLIGIPTG